MWFIGVEEEQETSAPPPKQNPRSAPVNPALNNPAEVVTFLLACHAFLSNVKNVNRELKQQRF